MVSNVSPLAHNVPIVDDDGNPTPYFQRMLAIWLEEKGVTDTLAEEAAPESRQIISGAGLTGGGDLTADRTLAVGAGTGITVNADDVAADPEYIRDIVAAFATAGTNMTITHNDGADTLTFDAAGGGGGSSWTAYTSTDGITIPVPLDTDDGVVYEVFVMGTNGAGGNAIYSFQVSEDDAVTFYSGATDYKTNSSGAAANCPATGSIGTGRAFAFTFTLGGMNTAGGLFHFVGNWNGVLSSGTPASGTIAGSPNSIGTGDYNGFQILGSAAGSMNGVTLYIGKVYP